MNTLLLMHRITLLVFHSIGNISLLIAVAFIWGVTNVFMKSGVRGLEKVHGSTLFSRIIAELSYLLINWQV